MDKIESDREMSTLDREMRPRYRGLWPKYQIVCGSAKRLLGPGSEIESFRGGKWQREERTN